MQFDKSQQLKDQYLDYALNIIGFEDTIITAGQGTYVFDADGNKIMDLNGGQFCAILGHGNKELSEFMAQKASEIQHTNTGTLAYSTMQALKIMHDITPEMDSRSIILSTGAEAIEFALRYAKNVVQKTGIVCFKNGYHGLTLGAQSVTYGGVFAKPVQSDIYALDCPLTDATTQELDEVINQFKSILENCDNIACALFEPIVSVGGMHVQQTYFMKAIKELCQKHGVVLIFDECQTGFGRTGHWFYYQAIDVVPDILVCAKGIGLGYPVSTVTITKQLIDQLTIPYSHYCSHQNDPFSANVINFGYDYITKHNVLEQVQASGTYFYNELLRLSQKHSILSKPRGKGLMLGQDLILPGVSDYRKISADFRHHLLTKGIMMQATNGGQTLRYLPTYLITKEEIDLFINIFDQELQQYQFLGAK